MFSFKSSRDYKAGLDDKDVLRGYKQAQEYLRKAKETYQAIMVRNPFLRDGTLSSPLSRSNLLKACIINNLVRG